MLTITILFALWALFYCTETAEVCTKRRCDFLKALLPLCIVLHHHAQGTDWPWPIDDDFCVLGVPVVMMFFFISGYGLEYKRSSKGLFLKDIPARLKKLFTPTFLPIVMYVSCLLVVGHIEKLWPVVKAFWYPLPYSWFVVVIAILYVEFYICASLAKSAKMFLLFFFVCSLSTIIALKLLHANPWMMASDLAVFVGALYRQYENYLLNILRKRWAKVATVAFSVGLVIVGLHFRLDFPNIYRLSSYLWLFLMFLMFSCMKIFGGRVIDFLTMISYDIYLCQGIVFDIVPYKEMNFALSFVVVLGLTIAIATFSHWAHAKVFGCR